MRKTLYLLNINGYSSEITSLTYPHIEFYANKIGADICKITERKFPDWHVRYEKLQIYGLAKERNDDWSLYFDSDTLIHPELPDLTTIVPSDTVAHNGSDFAGIRWKYDEYFMRDGRHIGSCNWLSVASSWCRDLWHPIEDLTYEEALANITVTVDERNTVIRAEHLVDDYALSRNIARYGLKFVTLISLWQELGFHNPNFFHHEYTVPTAVKVENIRAKIKEWQL